MRDVSLTLPQDAQERVRWLESLLTGADLADEVVRLPNGEAATPETAPPAEYVRSLLGEWLAGVLRHGLGQLPPEVLLHDFVEQPARLFGLQELVLMEGGDFWLRSVQAYCPLPPLRLDEPPAASAQHRKPRCQPAHGRRSRRRLTAALVGVGVLTFALGLGIGVRTVSPPTVSGIQTVHVSEQEDAGAIPEPGPSTDRPPLVYLPPQNPRRYLVAFAGTMEDWAERLEASDPKTLRKRLEQLWLNLGQVLAKSERNPLGPQEREMLIKQLREVQVAVDACLYDHRRCEIAKVEEGLKRLADEAMVMADRRPSGDP